MAVAAGADEVIGLVPPDFCQDDSVRFHAQAGFETAFRRYRGFGAEILRVEQMHLVRVVNENFACIFDGDDSFPVVNQAQQGFHEGGFAGAGRAGNDNVFPVVDGGFEECPEFPFFQQFQHGLVGVADFVGRRNDLVKQALRLVLVHAEDGLGGNAHGETALFGRRLSHQLRPLAVRHGQRQHRVMLVKFLALANVVDEQHAQPFNQGVGMVVFDFVPFPDGIFFVIDDARLVDDDFRNTGQFHERANAELFIDVVDLQLQLVGNFHVCLNGCCRCRRDRRHRRRRY